METHVNAAIIPTLNLPKRVSPEEAVVNNLLSVWQEVNNQWPVAIITLVVILVVASVVIVVAKIIQGYRDHHSQKRLDTYFLTLCDRGVTPPENFLNVLESIGLWTPEGQIKLAGRMRSNGCSDYVMAKIIGCLIREKAADSAKLAKQLMDYFFSDKKMELDHKLGRALAFISLVKDNYQIGENGDRIEEDVLTRDNFCALCNVRIETERWIEESWQKGKANQALARKLEKKQAKVDARHSREENKLVLALDRAYSRQKPSLLSRAGNGVMSSLEGLQEVASSLLDLRKQKQGIPAKADSL